MTPTKKVEAPDANVGDFFYQPNLTIDPPLAPAVVKSYSNPFLVLRNKKDEDVQMVDGVITVVSTNITTVLAQHNADNVVTGYPELKKGVEHLCSLVDKAGSTITGYVLFRRYAERGDGAEFFRLVPDGATCAVQGASLAFSDGTRIPVPEGEGL